MTDETAGSAPDTWKGARQLALTIVREAKYAAEEGYRVDPFDFVPTSTPVDYALLVRHLTDIAGELALALGHSDDGGVGMFVLSNFAVTDPAERAAVDEKAAALRAAHVDPAEQLLSDLDESLIAYDDDGNEDAHGAQLLEAREYVDAAMGDDQADPEADTPYARLVRERRRLAADGVPDHEVYGRLLSWLVEHPMPH